ncbi:TOM1-like protein 6 [Vigna radiata var. radiata]|uniref:TOM1-like protein 6 n=1 Tax=Vigna radiata var. radiata TaxID=3916 RepID=A0A1S3TW44_VIGRR|nr:TOM1-like protein 6 [Vigna radiata var. radiata]
MASSSFSSSSSATVAVDKATSDLLMGPDWTMNIEICDSINSNHWQPKDVVKAVKRRLQHRSSRVQFLALTLLETMVKNCGDFVHFQIAERNILEEMIKIIRKKADMQVRNKILALLDSWQEAFGGPDGRHPQYYWAYEELKRSGVVFPKRSPDAAPIFTPPPTHPNIRSMQAGYGMSSNSSKTLDETMATEIESLSMSSLESMRHVLDLLSDMLQAVNPSDREAVKDEVIIDLVDRCRTNQKKLMQMLTSTGDEELLGRGLELNDSIQGVLARHDAIASGTVFPIQGASSSSVPTEAQPSVDQSNVNSSTLGEASSTLKASSSAVVLSETQIQSDEEEEDEFAQLARRHSKAQPVISNDTATGSSQNSVSVNTTSTTPHVPNPATSVPSNALVLSNPPAPVTAAKDQDIIDLLSITLSVSPSPQTSYAPSPQTSYAPSASSQGMHQIPVQSTSEGYSFASQTYPGNLSYNSYVVPWAQPQSKSEFQAQPQQQTYQSRSQSPTPPSSRNTHYEFEQQHHQPTQQDRSQPQSEQLQSQPVLQSPHVLHQQPQHNQYSPHQQHLQPRNEQLPLQYQPQHQTLQSQPQPHPHPQPNLQQHSQYQPQTVHGHQPQPQPQQQFQNQPQQQQQFQNQPQQQFQNQPQQQFQNQHHQYPARYPPPPWAATPGYANYQNNSPATNLISTQANTAVSYPLAPGVRTPVLHNNSLSARGGVGGTPATATGQKTFVPSYRLFEDLNVFGNTDGKVSGSSSGLSGGTMGPGMIGGRK